MRRLFTLLAAACITASAFGKQISENTARTTARKYAPSGEFQPAKRLHGASGGNAPYYAFNLDHGYVIVSGDDELTELVGYSDSGSFDAESMPPQLGEWLDAYADYVAAVQRGEDKTLAKRALASRPTVVVAPLLTTKWNQDEPFNLQTPTFQTNTGSTAHCPTGCAATALAQVMKFFNWPETGVGSNSYTHPEFGTISADFSSHSYDWTNMRDTYNSGEYSSTEADAVATLMKDCGVALNMYYGQTESAAQLHSFYTALTENFRYTAKIVGHTDMSTAEFARCITDELDSTRPVLFTGIGDGGGHAFVADGYDSNGFLHINWGWGGYSDGYFDMNYMNPYGLGIGGGSGAFKWNQSAVLAKPLRDGETPYEQHTLSFVDTTDGQGGLTFKGEGTLIAGEDATIGLRNIYNSSPTTFNGDIAVAAFDQSGAIAKLGDAEEIANGFGSGYFYRAEFDFTLPTGGIADGTYTVRAVTRFTGKTEWEKFATNRFLTMTVAGGEISFSKPTPKLAVTDASLESSIVKGSALQATVTIHNSSKAVADGTINYTISNATTGATMATGTDHAIVYDNSDYAFLITASTSDYELGDYTIIINSLTATDGTTIAVENPAAGISFRVVDSPEIQRQLDFYDFGSHDQGLSVSKDTFSANDPANIVYTNLANINSEAWSGHIGIKVEDLTTGAISYNDFGTLNNFGSLMYQPTIQVSTVYTTLPSLADGVYRVSGVSREVVDTYTFPDWVLIKNGSHFDLRASGGVMTVLHPVDEISINQFSAAEPILIGEDNEFTYTVESKSDMAMDATLRVLFLQDNVLVTQAEKQITLSPYELRTETLTKMLGELQFSIGVTYTIIPCIDYGGTEHQGTPITFKGATAGIDGVETTAVGLWPNPATDVLHVGVNALRIDIYYSATGACVAQAADASEVAVAHLPAGYYVAVVTTNNGLEKIPFIKK